MKKYVFLIIATMCVLVLALVGCSTSEKTLQNTAEVWSNTTNKQSTEVITITNIDVAKLLMVDSCKMTITKTFSEDKLVVDFSLDEIKVTFSNSFSGLLKIVLGVIKPKPDITMTDIKGVLDNFEEFRGSITFSDDYSKIDYAITAKINYQSPKYNINETGSAVLKPDMEYNQTIDKAIGALQLHTSEILKPSSKGVEIVDTQLVEIIKQFVAEYAVLNPNEKPLALTIKSILGVGYSEFLAKKVNVTSSNCDCETEKNFIYGMDVTLTKVQLLYTNSEMLASIKKVIEMIAPDQAGSVDIIGNFIGEVTPGVSCIEIGEIKTQSTFKLN